MYFIIMSWFYDHLLGRFQNMVYVPLQEIKVKRVYLLISSDIVPGRMTLLVTVFLVLVNIFNTITTNIPKVKKLTLKQKKY